MRLRVLDTGLAPARWNVAMSAALLESVDEGGPPTLRFHRYPASCVVGRNQDVEVELDLAGCEAAEVEIARRVTGGGAVVMGPGVLAFDLVLPVARRDAFAMSKAAGEALAASLCDLGFDASLATPGSIEIGGLKVSGSAGRLGRRAALHQATLILDLAEAAPLTLLRRRTEGGRPTADPRHRVGELGERSHSSQGAAKPPPPQAGAIAYALTQPETLSPVGRGEQARSAARVRGSDLSGKCGAPSPGRFATRPLPTGERVSARAVEGICDRPAPQGEGDQAQPGGGGIAADAKRNLTNHLAAAFGLTPDSALPSPAELARADVILAETVGRDDFVFAGEVTERRAA